MTLSVFPASPDTSREKATTLPDLSSKIADLLSLRDEAALSSAQTAEIAEAIIDAAIRQYPDVSAALVVAHLRTQLAESNILLEDSLAA